MSEEKEVKKDRSSESEKPVSNSAIVDCVFPPFPDPDDLFDFDDDISSEEKQYYKTKFPDVRTVVTQRLHCTACDRHLGSAHHNEVRIKAHPMLRTLICKTCHSFYNSGEFDKGDDGSELYCRWCGQGGQVYCCSDCPHVFCAKCVKRNFGIGKIREIENTDDWKCFKCNSKCLWDLRAVCWALLRYCDVKNKITQETLDPRLKEEYLKDCAVDFTECCKNKRRNVKKKEEGKKDTENNSKKVTPSPPSALTKIPQTIQVRKFASVLPDEKKAKKRPLEQPSFIRNPIPIAPVSKAFNNIPTTIKRVRGSNPNINNITPIRIMERSSIRPYTPPQRFPSRQSFMPMPMLTFNGLANSYNPMMHNDHINLSLDSLTQGLDMASVNPVNANANDDLVCTPDLPPLEPFCEVTEDNSDDDVHCITPAPPVSSLKSSSNVHSPLNKLASDNIIQMTENDVTVNKLTGGLKFRVDPQTLSSNKMYRLPDGRVFAITANPNMPAGYSATIVALAESKVGNTNNKTPNKKVTTPKVTNKTPIRNQSSNKSKLVNNKSRVTKKKTNSSNRICDLNVPVEWFRYNLVDSIDALQYSQNRLNKLRKEANTVFLRTRSVEEIKKLHKRMDNILNTSITRFTEIRKHLNDELKEFINKKSISFTSDAEIDDDDDDDVEILPNNDDPIFIDENSVDSVTNQTQDLTENSKILEDSNATVARDGNENEADKEDNEIDDSNFNDSTTVINSSKSSDETNKNINDDEREKNPEETQVENISNTEENEKCENGGDNHINDTMDISDNPSDKTIETIKNNIDDLQTDHQNESSNSTENQGDNLKNNEKDITIEKPPESEKYLNKSMEVDEANNANEMQQSEKDTAMDTEKDSENDTEKDTEKETAMDTEKDSENDTENDTEKDTENDTEKDTENYTEKDSEKEPLMSEDLIADLLKDDTCDGTVASFDNSVDFGDLE